ncbi:MAG TPA: GNAT family N-acetyltransferase [Segeticoccus sp.]|uniref:GNAT family N-acetyltransferase n=1 Tax=Segeticoccus sp. TaxID=2706531 RepID=UPI002D7FE5FA|nr:GNAT family N-acetyltransferase [Segeticoccus sp.]HET8599294.1 GNAT family N-acetyltransferase [Segeticoccus sp.]
MLRTHSPVRALTPADRDRALEVCARNPAANVFVAARVLEGALQSMPGALLGYADGDELQALCWASANVVPVECDDEAVDAFAGKLRRHRRRCSSLFGPAEQVLPLWSRLTRSWGSAREVRANQPLLAVDVLARQRAGVSADPGVRVARPDEVDLVVPAAAAMFREEIGYPPFEGSDRAYRNSVATLIARQHTYLRLDDEGRVLFKADVGSAAIGAAQVQGVWVSPAHRGHGLAAPAMAAVVDLVTRDVAPLVSLYVNDYNAPARSAYERVGFTQTGRFATVLL